MPRQAPVTTCDVEHGLAPVDRREGDADNRWRARHMVMQFQSALSQIAGEPGRRAAIVLTKGRV